MEDVYKNIAIKEILHPTFAVTEQYLEVHKITRKNAEIVVARIDMDEPNQVVVYLPLENQKYYLAIYLSKEKKPSIQAVTIQAGSYVYICATSNETSLEEMMNIAKVTPISTGRKGDVIRKDIKHKVNRIKLGIGYDDPDEIDHKVKKLLDYLEPYQDDIRKLTEKATVELIIAYFGYSSQMWGIALDETIVQRLAKMNLSVDIDLYAAGPELL